MAAPTEQEVWDRVKLGPRPGGRGFDDRHTELASWHVWPMSAAELAAVEGKPLERPLTDRQIRGSFAQMAHLAGWVAGCRINPTDPEQVELVDTFADVLEDMLRGLRGALRAHTLSQGGST